MLLNKVPVRLRLSLFHAMWMATLFVSLGLGTYKLVEINLYDSLDGALISSANSVLEAKYREKTQSGVEEVIQDPLEIDQLTGTRFIKPFAQVLNVSGKIHNQSDNVAINLPVTPLALKRARKGLMTLETFQFSDRPPLRQITMPVILEGEFEGDLIQIGAATSHIERTLEGIAFILSTVLPILLILSIILGYILTARALKPVIDITQAAKKVGGAELSIRLPVPAANDELQQLSKTFNAMFDRLEDAVTRLRRFAGDVSHELRTPLAVLRGEAELAMRRDREIKDYKSAFQVIIRETMHMSAIVDDLLLLARAESRSVAMTWVICELEPFLSELISGILPIFEKGNLSLQSEIESEVSFECSEVYLSLALKNILLNAAKHSANGQEIRFAASSEKNWLVFTISDDGEGIPEESIGSIFDPFYRADTARNRSSGGAGIGLSLALALVKLHDGRIHVDSTVNKGTTFSVRIPKWRRES